MNGGQSWVNYTNGPPIPAQFVTTNGMGPALCIDKNTGQGYYLTTGGLVAPMGSNYILPQTYYQPTDSSFGQAIQRAIDASYAEAFSVGYGYGSGPSIFIPGGQYTSNVTLQTHHNVEIFGEGVGGPSGPMSKITFTGQITGFIGQGYGTTGDSGYGNAGLIGGRLALRKLSLLGGFNGVLEGDHYGVNLRGGGLLEDLFIEQFPGEGIYSFTDAASLAGNSNGSYVKNVFIQRCRHGFMVDGQDSNAWNVLNLSLVLNRGCGVLDSSALGNFYFGCHVATNGDGGINFPSRCSDGVRRYCVFRGQEAWCALNPPSGAATSNLGWLYVGPGGINASWPVWTLNAPYRCGSGYVADNVNSAAFFVNYQESDSLPPQMAGNAMMLGPYVTAVDLGGNPWPGVMWNGLGGMNFLGSILARGGLNSNGTSNRITASDPALYINTTNAYATLAFEQNGALQSTIFAFGGTNFYDTVSANGHIFRYSGGNQSVVIDSGGLAIIGAKVLKINGNQVVGQRQAAVTAPTGGATIDAQARTAINDLIARLQAHGLIS